MLSLRLKFQVCGIRRRKIEQLEFFLFYFPRVFSQEPGIVLIVTGGKTRPTRDREQQNRSVETESTPTFEAVHLSKRVRVLHFIIVPNFLPGRQKVGFVHTRHVIGDKNVYVFKLARRRTMKWILILVQALLQTRTARLLRPSITYGDVARNDSQGRF